MEKLVVKCVILWQLFLYTEGVSLTYILKRQKTHVQPSCIAEGLTRYAAIGWVYPMPENGEALPNTTTKFIPDLKSDYDCRFSKNDKCNLKWAVRDWQIDETSSKTREYIDDNRWEDIPTVLISNASKEFEHRFYLENSKKVAFSVRAVGQVELFLCTGWNPKNYPCYYFTIGEKEIVLYKLLSFPPSSDPNPRVDRAQLGHKVITEDEWRSFELNFDKDGVALIEKHNDNRLLVGFDAKLNDDPLEPTYLLMRSTEQSLWKVMENTFMYTKTAQISRLGPQFVPSYKDLCISLFVATCPGCEMSFFYMNGTQRHELKYVQSTNYKWIEIKLKQENIRLERFNLFVETKLVEDENKTKGWWAYDSVRVCNENEVKVSYLKLNKEYAEDDTTVSTISCHPVKTPSIRPNSLEYDEIQDNIFSDFPPVEASANDTSITLKWPEEDPDKYLTYFVYYRGNDICSNDISKSARLMSGGFLTTKHNEITITNLVPFTLYNITLSSVLHEKDKEMQINTLETAEPTLEELPIHMHIRPLDSAVNVTWDRPPCSARGGRLIYSLTISNDKFNFKKSFDLQLNNSYYIDGLRPYTDHNLTVITARNAQNLINGVHTSNLTFQFTTLPGLAPRVRNLELYAIGPNKAYFRYDLPTNPQGIPAEVEVYKCNALSRAKCKALIYRIARCAIWPQKLCVEADYLMPEQNYTFRISIKNANTNAFGKETEIKATTEERVPAPPKNITYRVVDCQATTDYCHLNISWLHPYNPNGTIDAFNIVLNSTNFNNSYSEEDQSIHETYKIINDSYLPRYTYQVKYVPYSHEYNLYIQSVNSKYKSEFASTTVKTADLGDHIDQSPKLLGKGDKAIVFKLPPLDRRLESYTLTIGVQDFNESVPLRDGSIKNQKLADNICHPYGVTWVSQVLEVKDNQTNSVTIKGLDDDRTIKPNTKYCIIFIITNNYKGAEHDVVYYEKLTTPESSPTPHEEDGPFSHLYMLLLLLLLVPVGFGIYWWLRKRNRNRKSIQHENQYETIPFSDHDKNYANNRAYDHLLHK